MGGILFIVLFVFVFTAVADDMEHLTIANVVAVCLAMTEVALLFWVPRMYAFHAFPEKRVLIGAEKRKEVDKSQYAPSYFHKADGLSVSKKSVDRRSANVVKL